VPYKKISVAIDAFNRLELPLKIVGDGPLRRSLQSMAKPNIEFLGWVDDHVLPSLYASCQALVFPGEEDFGIVPLEAQASGRPVIAYGTGGVRETVLPINSSDRRFSPSARPTGVFFDTASPESLMTAVRFFEAKKDAFEPAALREHACGFSRERHKARMKAFVESCLQRSGGRG
jgi:glycosyltransferase involved in cell wall biosynthesis